MAVSNVSSSSSAYGYTSSGSSASGLASNFTTFLSLLTTQLKNQNPLDPLDTNQFTQQLVQFAGVEQQLKTNDTLSSLLVSSQTAQAGAALGLVGRTVTADGDTAKFENGEATWSLNSPKDGATGKVTIRNASGAVVYSGDITLKEGDQNFEWDGKKSDGSTATDGLYTISVDAKDADGNAVNVTSEVSGVVDGVDLSTGQAVLLIGDLKIPLGSLKAVKATKTS